MTVILGFDPGRDKCGLAVMGRDRKLEYHQVVTTAVVIDTVKSLCQQFSVEQLVIGNQTTSKQWRQKLEEHLPHSISIVTVDERNSSLEARDRYWQMYPPKGLQKIIPQGMRLPPRPIDDIVAILLIERYLQNR
ncbi:pre-16S rRNA-processing nuclease YqgF [Candidatus Gracilibacteria bacterium]|jgi:RNase H-fold protein (predicted Holliday junction resolvase)|nr:pre-16S rRNA-processing nuclease YqgF [Candidatus Gracilibacteria bacterium]NJP17675.1 pre-16S rRNA-processing nuclease YqgF [Hydrococcus sp. CRU_1_1]